MNYLKFIDKFCNNNNNKNNNINNSDINLFIKNYKKIISNNSSPNNTNNIKMVTIVACHTNTLLKYNAVINNIPYLIFPNNDIIIINSSNEKYSYKLKQYIDNKIVINAPNNKIIKYIEIPNDKYIDIGKYIHVLNMIETNGSLNKEYEFVVLINDSIIIKNSITHFYNMIIK